MKKHVISLRQSGFFSDLICDFEEGSEEVDPFCHRRPSAEAISEQLAEKSNSFTHRKALHEVLSQQYLEAGIHRQHQIDQILESNTFTITTGHQLSLFTGPLYFIYKIVHVINIAANLKQRFPNYNFIPVYWMASEDHDFEEIKSFKVASTAFRWNRKQEGAVGRMNTKGLEEVAAALATYLGDSAHGKELVALFENAYLHNKSVAAATHFLVDQLFGDKGLLVLDGDSPRLKALMTPLFEQELVGAFAKKHTEEPTAKLAEKYFAQVHVRDCNLFYLTDKHRGRMVKTQEGFLIEGTTISKTVAAWVAELQQHPERFSPNVVLRPLYQETVLPNLAYIGGGGEIAYWLQLKTLFEEASIPFPILWLRQSFLFIPTAIKRKMEKLQLDEAAIWQSKKQLEKQLIGGNSDLDLNLTQQENLLAKMFEELEQLATTTDHSMVGAVKAQKQKQRNGLANLKRKLLRAEKRRMADKMQQLNAIIEYCFPNGGLQERSQNFSALIGTFGRSWWQYLWEQDPWTKGIIVLTEDLKPTAAPTLENNHVEN